jgi:hypothetical protein
MTSEMEALHAIQRAASTRWRAAAWLLNRAGTDDLLPKHGPIRRVAALKILPVEICEIERFATEMKTMVVRVVTDTTTMCDLHNRIDELLAAAKSRSRTAPDADPPLASDSEENTFTEHQPDASVLKLRFLAAIRKS